MEEATHLGDPSRFSDSEKVIRTLYKITSDYEHGLAHQVQELLKLGCERFDLEIGILSHCEDNVYTVLHCHCPEQVPLNPGDQFDFEETYCSITLNANAPTGFEHMGESDYNTHPAYKKFQLESYIGIPVFLKGETYGTLNFSSPVPRERKFSEIDIDALKLMGIWIGNELERHQRQLELESSLQQIRLAEQMFRQGIEASPSAMLMINDKGVITFANQQAERLFEYSAGELQGQVVEILIPPSIRGRHPKLRNKFFKSPSTRPMGLGRHLLACKRSGDEFPVEVGLNLIETPQGMLILCALNDLSERKQYEAQILEKSRELEQANQKLFEQNTTDELTQVGNRRLLSLELETYLLLSQRGKRTLSAIMLDLDNFKSFNDTYGHPLGDQALVALAQSLKSTARRGDLITRYGGEEFTVILPDTDEQGAIESAERFRQAIAAIDTLPIGITASLGVSTMAPKRDAPIEPLQSQLLHEADKALYQAKKSGKNQVCHFRRDLIR
ncbi:diguanylate cyclase [Dongshaea marina]|uniref:diguanylate cyclase n=1 Tax=Dongshaea marina TaxID=2047966 RepID=UPI000D3ECA13|nr:diguanylate cyclase [Dongshaea marina]